MKVSVFGSGYVGLVQAAVLAGIGHEVICIDSNTAAVERLSQGIVPFFEPGLERLVQDGQTSGRLRFTSAPKDGIKYAQIHFIAVGTPSMQDGSADLSNVMAVAASIAEHTVKPPLIVLKSTVPVGTGDKVRAQIASGLAARDRGDIEFDVASNPEFLKEGSAVVDCAKPDRIVVGVATKAAEETLRELYAPLNRNHEKIIVMDVRSAELTKYAANAMLATKISFMNEMANLADRMGANIEMVRRGIGSDPRIGYDFIYPGIGFGGSCFPKDLRAMIHSADELDFDAVVLKSVAARNERQKLFLFDKIVDRFGTDLHERTFALWGLAFKPNTDDIRESPACVLMEALWSAGATVRAFDPKAMPRCKERYGDRPDLILCENQDEALLGADALIVATEWRTFQAPDFEHLRRQLKTPLIFDGRNIFDHSVARRSGVEIKAVGRR